MLKKKIKGDKMSKKFKIPKITRYNLSPNMRGTRVVESTSLKGKWVRFTDIEWILLNIEALHETGGSK